MSNKKSLPEELRIAAEMIHRGERVSLVKFTRDMEEAADTIDELVEALETVTDTLYSALGKWSIANNAGYKRAIEVLKRAKGESDE